MRRIRYAVVASLDGWIAGPNGEADWIPHDPDVDFAALFAQFDTLLMGRRTYEAVQAQPGGHDMLGGLAVLVASRTLDPRAHPKVRVLGAGLPGALTALRATPGKDIWLFGGGGLFASLLDLDLVDTVEVVVAPVLLGGGIPLLPARPTRALLSLTSHRLYEQSGMVSLTYDVKRKP